MSAANITFGIQSHEGDVIDEVSIKQTVQTAKRAGSDGEFIRVHTFQRMLSGSVKGGGVAEVVAGVGDPGVDYGDRADAGGLAIIPTVEDTEKNTDFNSFSYDWEYYPFAQDVA